MEEGEGSVGIFMHADPCLDVMGPGGSGGDLQDPIAVSHGVVVCDGALCLDAEDVVDLAGVDERHEGVVLEFGLGGETPVAVGQVGVGDEAVGGLDRVDPRQRQFLDRRSWRVPKARSERPRASGE